MKHYIASPFAVMCALCAIHPALSQERPAVAEEEMSLEWFPLETALPSEKNTVDQETSTEQKAMNVVIEEDPVSEEHDLSWEEEDSVCSYSEEEDDDDEEFNSFAASPSTIQATDTPLAQSNQYPYAQSSFISIAPTYAYTHIKPHGNASFKGNLGGAELLYEFRPAYGLYESLKVQWRQGLTKAKGESRFVVDVSAEERLGISVSTDKDRWIWTFFSGIGYRFLGHHLQVADGASMRLNYSEFYCPVGIFTDYEVNDWFMLGLHGTWMPQIFPSVTLLPFSGTRWATTSTFGNTLVELPLTFFAGRKRQFFLTVNPTFEYWQDGHSTASTTTGLPLGLRGTTYFFWGADLRLGYAF